MPYWLVSSAIRLSSLTPEATSTLASASTDAQLLDRNFPRNPGIAQKVHAWLQPSATRMYAVWLAVRRWRYDSSRNGTVACSKCHIVNKLYIVNKFYVVNKWHIVNKWHRQHSRDISYCTCHREGALLPAVNVTLSTNGIRQPSRVISYCIAPSMLHNSANCTHQSPALPHVRTTCQFQYCWKIAALNCQQAA